MGLKDLFAKSKEKQNEKKILALQEKERVRIHKAMVAQDAARKVEDRKPKEGYFISLSHINKIYPNHVQAVFDFNLDIKEHEFIVFVGPSGCGKSTTLRMIAGLEDITAGDLFIDQKFSNYILPKDRDIAMVFQNYALYPHLSVYDNLAFSLKIRKIPKEEIDKRIDEVAEMLQIKEYLKRKPGQLSGGQCQRVALGRAIVRDTKLFLMDEPLSNLDAKLRVSMRSEIINLHNKLKATTIYVTHDQTEAMTMASRIVVMNKGYIQQIGTPQEIYDHPANTFVASFIGSPSMNLIDATFDKNKVVFDNVYEIKLDKKEKQNIISFYKNQLDSLSNELTENEKNNEYKNELLNKKDTLIHDENYEKKLSEINEELELVDKANVRRNELINLISSYKEIIKNEQGKVIFGIRPDDINDVDELNERIKPSTPFEINCDICELLGNAYYIHSKFNNVNIVANFDTYKHIQFNDKVNVVFNLNKYHLFDNESKNLIF